MPPQALDTNYNTQVKKEQELRRSGRNPCDDTSFVQKSKQYFFNETEMCIRNNVQVEWSLQQSL